MQLLVKKLTSPRCFYAFISAVEPWAGMLSILLFLLGFFMSLVEAPADFQQGEAYRILYLHVPSAMLSLGIYFLMSIAVIIFLVWKVKLADMFSIISAYLGALFTLITLVTGMLWGKPMWGTFWIWDVRLTSELLLFFIYLGIITLRLSLFKINSAAFAGGLLTLVGVINLPIIHYSVSWWHTLHQGPTLLQFAKPHMPASMLIPLIVMLLAFVSVYVYLVCLWMRAEILTREKNTRWVRELII